MTTSPTCNLVKLRERRVNCTLKYPSSSSTGRDYPSLQEHRLTNNSGRLHPLQHVTAIAAPVRIEFNCPSSIALLKLYTLRLDSQVTWSPSANPIGLHETRLVHLHRVIKRSTNSGHRPLTPHCTCQLTNYKFTTKEITTNKQDSHCLHT